MRLKWIKTFTVLFFSVVASFAQEVVKGVVKDESGLPLPGVTVMVKGKKLGGATDFDGKYSISVEKGATLVFSFVGMKTVEKKVTGSQLNVVMKVDAEELSDVVVVGYSTVKKEDFVGSATQLNTESIVNKNVSTVSQALAGEAAGVKVFNVNGQPGSEAKIRIRGFGSVNGNRNPLYVLDGVPYTGNLTSINPDDIENLVVLKDAAATAVYGARGANGVILITTKRGKAGHSEISVESKLGYNMLLLPRYQSISSPEQYIELAWEALYNRGKLTKGTSDPVAFANSNLFGKLGIDAGYNMWDTEGENLIDPNTGKIREGVKRKYTPENWADYAFQTSLRTENNISIKGGEGNTTYYTNIGHLNDVGYALNTSYERLSARLNLTHRAKPWLRGEFNLGYSLSKWANNGQDNSFYSIFFTVEGMPPIYPLFKRDEKGNKVFDQRIDNYAYDMGENRGYGALNNAVATSVLDKKQSERHSVNANFLVGVDFTKHISFDARLGAQYYTDNENNYNNPYYGSAESSNGSLDKYRVTSLFYTALQMLKYNNRFGSHGINAFIAHEINSYKYEYLSASRKGLVIPTATEFASAIEQVSSNSFIRDYTLESFFAQAMYDYDNKYLFSGSIRRDGSSRFMNHKWGNFGSVGVGWVVTKEDFLANNPYLQRLKLKASYGVIGDQEGNSGKLNRYYLGYNIYRSANFMGIPAATFERVGYPDLTWEKANIFQVGAEVTLFESKMLDLNVEYYNKRTTNLFFDSRLAPSTGNAILTVNDGVLVNNGLELGITAHVVNTENFYLDVVLNTEFLRNRLEKLPLDKSTGKEKVIDISGSYARTAGRSIYDFYLREWAGVNPDTGAAQWKVNYVDANANGVYDSGEEIASLHEYLVSNPNAKVLETLTEEYTKATLKFNGKSAIPTVSGSFSLSTGYKGFRASAQFLYSLGAYAYDSHYAQMMTNSEVGNSNWNVDILNRWRKPGDITDVPRLTSNRGGDTQYASSSTRFLRKADYLALNNVSLSYTLDENVAKYLAMKELTFSLTGDNLWLSTNKKGFNPTTSETGSSDAYRYYPLSNVTFGVKARF